MKISEAWDELTQWVEQELSGPFRDLLMGKIEELEEKYE
jgi:hypothetical protein